MAKCISKFIQLHAAYCRRHVTFRIRYLSLSYKKTDKAKKLSRNKLATDWVTVSKPTLKDEFDIFYGSLRSISLSESNSQR